VPAQLLQSLLLCLQTIQYNLLPEGDSVAVSGSNRLLYIYLLADWHLNARLGRAAAAFAGTLCWGTHSFAADAIELSTAVALQQHWQCCPVLLYSWASAGSRVLSCFVRHQTNISSNRHVTGCTQHVSRACGTCCYPWVALCNLIKINTWCSPAAGGVLAAGLPAACRRSVDYAAPQLAAPL
jgi:hypothetical protein